MKNVRRCSVYSSDIDTEDSTLARTIGVSQLRKQGADVIILNNPKIDHQLLEGHEHLVKTSKGGGRVKKQGADYHLAHPLARRYIPTDAYHLGKSSSEVQQS